MTYMGHPAAPYPYLGSDPSHSIDLGDLQTLPGKVEDKAQGAGTKNMIMLVSKNVVAAGA